MIGHIRNGMGTNPAISTGQLHHILVFESILPKHGAKLEDNLLATMLRSFQILQRKYGIISASVFRFK